jgi:hypothetical protein
MSVLIEVRMASRWDGHGIKALSPEGIELAKRVGAEQIRDRFTHTVCSSVRPCTETLKYMYEGAGIARPPSPGPPFPLEQSLPMVLHELCAKADAAKGGRFLSCLAAAPEETRRYAKALHHLVLAYGWVTFEDRRILFVTCSPFLELLMMGFGMTILWPAAPCAGIRIHVDGADSALEYEAPDLIAPP